MARGPRVTIEDKIAKQEEKVAAAKEKYEAALAVLEELNRKKDEDQYKYLLDLCITSGKSIDELEKLIRS